MTVNALPAPKQHRMRLMDSLGYCMDCKGPG